MHQHSRERRIIGEIEEEMSSKDKQLLLRAMIKEAIPSGYINLEPNKKFTKTNLFFNRPYPQYVLCLKLLYVGRRRARSTHIIHRERQRFIANQIPS